MNINRTAAAVVIAVIMSGCTTVPRKDVEPLWLTAVKADYAANGKLSIAIETNRQYFVRGQKISLYEMCFRVFPL